MKVIVDTKLCAVHGDCVVEAPEIFDLEDDSDVVAVINPEPGEELRPQLERAVLACPLGAIRVEG